MVRRSIPELGRESYEKLTAAERRELWTRIVSENLGISLAEAGTLIRRNNSLPVWEIIDENDERTYLLPDENHLSERVRKNKIYPRFNANAVLLARLSQDYRGPRGSRPIFASLENIARISSDAPSRVSYWRKSLGRNWEPLGRQLIDLKVSASNPDNVPDGVRFEYDDVRRGVYITPSMDEETAGALGIIFSDGSLVRGTLRLTGGSKDEKFYNDVVIPSMNNAFNLLQEDLYDYTQPSGFSGNDYTFFRLAYSSTALTTYLRSQFDFRQSEEERKTKGFPDRIKSKGFAAYRETFLKHFLAASSGTNICEDIGSLSVIVPDVSKPLLEDIGELVEGFVERRSIALIKIRGAGSYKLSISTVLALELYFSGMLDVNPRIKARVEWYLENCGTGRRAYRHLQNLYGDAVEPYRRARLF